MSQNIFELASVIEVLLSSDNNRRLEAERYVNEIPLTNFDQGIDGFLSCMHNENPHISSMSALLLKKKYLDSKNIFVMLSREKLETILHGTQECMKPDKPLQFLKRCCDILVKLYTFCDQKKELIGLIQSFCTSEEKNMKLALMYLIEIICEFAFDDNLLMQNSAALEGIFQRGLEDSANEIRVAAFKTLTIFLSSITDEKLVKRFNSVLEILLAKAIELIKFDQESGITALESFNQLIEAHPKFVKPILSQMLVIFTEIMGTPQLLINLRTTAMHGVLLLCMNHPSLIRKSNYFKSTMVETYMRLLAEDETTPLEEWAHELLNENISKNDISVSCEQHLEQIHNELGSKFMLPLFVSSIQKCLARHQPNYQHAGLIALAILTENCHDSFKGELKNMLGLIVPLLNSQHPRIVHDILIAMGYMSEEFAPEIQQNYGATILGFIELNIVHAYPKVQYRAVQCLQNFEKGLQPHPQLKIIEPHLDSILGKMGTIFEQNLANNSFLMLEAVMNSLVAIACRNNFAKYYPVFMPGLKTIISTIQNDTPQKDMIRAKTVETMGHLLSSVKDHETLFKPDCEMIMQSLINLESQLADDDTLHRAMFTVYENVVECLRSGFEVYSDFVMKKVLEAVNRKVDFKVIDETDSQQPKKNPNMNKLVKMKLDFKIDGVKSLVLNTDHLEQKIQAANLLSSMAEYLGPYFNKYSEVVVPTIISLVSYKSNKEIRNNMVQTAKCMVLNAAPGLSNSLFKLLFPAICDQLATVLRLRKHQEASNIVEAISEMMPVMPQQIIAKLPEIMQAVLAMVKSLVADVEKVYSEKQMDDELNEEMSDETDEIEEVLQFVQKIMVFGRGIPAFDHLKSMFPKEYEFTL